MAKMLVLLLCSLALQAATIYQVNRTVGAGFVTGTITTDDTTGILSASNILTWDLTINNGSTSDQLSNTLVGNNVFVVGTLLSATASQLFFNFSGESGSRLLFYENSTDNFWCLQSSSFCIAGPSSESVGIAFSPASAARSGSVVIADTAGGSAVPEPSTWALVALSGSVLGLLRRSR
jgi:hypothetical protein